MVLLVGNKLWWWNIYGGYIAVTVVLYFLVLAFCCLCAWQQRPLARDLGVLCDRIAAVRSGNLTDSLALPEDADLHQGGGGSGSTSAWDCRRPWRTRHAASG